MAIFKCKMCGGSLDIAPNTTVAKCEYCGVKQTIPRLDDEKRANFYDRANHYRRNNEYDKAMSIYEQILAEDKTDAEAYWSIVLCRYGIVYVEDPVTHRRIPTINRTQTSSILSDPDYQAALQHADGYQRDIYTAEAETISKIQKGILDISQKEEPFDVFICYKESDSSGQRNPYSVLAQELYYELTESGYRVFFSRITLEDKLGTAYEPYIFAALQSAKVMVVVGTKAEYFEAVWVRNEWSRYLSLIQNGESKVLIPAYRDMDPYDLPREFSHLQAQDMSKLGFMQDLTRGIGKILPKNNAAAESYGAPAAAAAAASGAMIPNYVKRISMFVADGNFDDANEYCDKVLDLDPENADAHFYALLAAPKVHCKSVKELAFLDFDFTALPQYQRAYRMANSERKAQLDACVAPMRQRLQERGDLEAVNQVRSRVHNKLQRRRNDLGRLIREKSQEIAKHTQAIQQQKTTFGSRSRKKTRTNEQTRQIEAYAYFVSLFIILVGAIVLIAASGIGAILIGLLLIFSGVSAMVYSYIELSRQYWMRYVLSTRILFYLLSLTIVGIYLSVIALKGRQPDGTTGARDYNAGNLANLSKSELEKLIRAANAELNKLNAALGALPESVDTMSAEELEALELQLSEQEKTFTYHVVLISFTNAAVLAQELSHALNVSPANAMNWLHSLPTFLVKNVSVDKATALSQKIGNYGRVEIRLASI